MNIIDLLIILLIISSLIRGAQIGSIRQVISTLGFFVGLLLGAWLEKLVVHLAHSALSRSLLALIVTLAMALVGMSIGEYAGIILRGKLQKHMFKRVDNILGSVVGVVTLLLTVWLAAAVVVTLPFPGLQEAVRSSFFVSNLTQELPNAPNVVADLGHLIDPNGFPKVFAGQEPSPGSATLPNIGELQPAVVKDAPSVLKIEGRGCGGIVEGSGFVVTSGLVATNAHVVAGVSNPVVIEGSSQHAAQAVWFDPNLDFAVLAVDHLQTKPLILTNDIAAKGSAAAVLGYPGGGSFTAQPAAIVDDFTATGRNIYNQGLTNRDIYEIKATVIPGNSGGPLVRANGDVIGVVFAESTTYNNVGYALTMPKVNSEIQQAEARGNRAVSTGSCAQ